MKKLIIINIVLIILTALIPTVRAEMLEKMSLTCDIVIEKPILTKINEENISSRTLENVRENTKIDFISNEGIEFIKEKEDCFTTAKKLDGEPYYTIGFGHYGSDVSAGETITREDAEDLLLQDMQKYCSEVANYCDYLDLNQNQFDALVSFNYNCGFGNLKKITGYQTRSVEEIAEHFEAYTKSKSEKNRKGLLNRRIAEKDLYLK